MYAAVGLLFAVLIGIIAVALWWNYQYQAYDNDIVKHMGRAMSQGEAVTLSYYPDDGGDAMESAVLSDYGVERARVILDITERALTFVERPKTGAKTVLSLGEGMSVTVYQPSEEDTVYVYFADSARKCFTLSNYRITARLRSLIADESAAAAS